MSVDIPLNVPYHEETVIIAFKGPTKIAQSPVRGQYNYVPKTMVEGRCIGISDVDEDPNSPKEDPNSPKMKLLGGYRLSNGGEPVRMTMLGYTLITQGFTQKGYDLAGQTDSVSEEERRTIVEGRCVAFCPLEPNQPNCVRAQLKGFYSVDALFTPRLNPDRWKLLYSKKTPRPQLNRFPRQSTADPASAHAKEG